VFTEPLPSSGHMRHNRNWKCEDSMHGRDNFKSLCVDERIILKCIVNKLVQNLGIDSFGTGLGPVADFCEYCSEP
jgi:hypothetical protein